MDIIKGKNKPQRSRRMLLYGIPGIGKSTFASHAPAPIFIPAEDGLDDIAADQFPVQDTIAGVFDCVKELTNGEHNYRTVVIDTLDGVERLIWESVCEQHGVKAIEQVAGGFGKGFSIAAAGMSSLLKMLGQLRAVRNMHVIFLAHAKTERFDDPENEPYDRYAPKLHHRAAGHVIEWCDEVLFASYKTFTTTVELGFGREAKRGVSGGERIVRCTSKPAAIAKNRLNLVDQSGKAIDTVPLDGAKFFAHPKYQPVTAGKRS